MYLFDTHYLIWAMYEPHKLTTKAQDIFLHHPKKILFSAASIFEIEIKKSVGKINIVNNFHSVLLDSGMEELPILSSHAAHLNELPLLHKDPFDRLLIAQAVSEDLVLVTKDEQIHNYYSIYKGIKEI